MQQTVPIKLVNAGLNKVLADLLDNVSGGNHKGLLASMYFGLIVAPYPGFSLGLVRADLTEAVFGGYARVLASWSAAGVDPTGRPEVFSQAVRFNPSDSSASAQVVGVALYDALTNGNLVGVGILPNPVTLGTPTDFAVFVGHVEIPLDNADWGQSAMMN